MESRFVGSAYVFEFDSVKWQETNILIPEDGNAGDRFGTSVQISGEAILIGSRLNDENGKNSGSGYLFNLVNDTWVFSKKLLAQDGGEYDFFGSSVSIYQNKAIVGAYRDNDHGNDSGSAYIYDLDLIFHNGFE